MLITATSHTSLPPMPGNIHLPASMSPVTQESDLPGFSQKATTGYQGSRFYDLCAGGHTKPLVLKGNSYAQVARWGGQGGVGPALRRCKVLSVSSSSLSHCPLENLLAFPPCHRKLSFS